MVCNSWTSIIPSGPTVIKLRCMQRFSLDLLNKYFSAEFCVVAWRAFSMMLAMKSMKKDNRILQFVTFDQAR